MASADSSERVVDSSAGGDPGAGVTLRTRGLAGAAVRRRAWLWAGLGALYLLSFNGQWLITPDSASYLSVAKTFATEGRLGHPLDWSDQAGPGFPVLIGTLMRFVGPEGFWAFDLAMLVLVPINLALVYRLVGLYADEATAVMVTLLTGITQLFFTYSFCLLADWPFVTGALVYLVGLGYLEKQIGRWWVWSLLMLVGLAIMACMRSVFFVFPLATLIGLPVHWVRRGQVARLGWAGGGVVGVMVVGLMLVPSSAIEWMYGDMKLLIETLVYGLPETLGKVASGQGWAFISEVFPRVLLGSDLGPWLNVALTVPLLVAVLRLVRINLVWALVILGFMAQALLLYTSRRYLLPAVPLLVYAWWDLLCAVDRWGADRVPRRRWVERVVMVVFWLVVAGNLIKVSGFALEQHRRPFWDYYNRGRYKGLVEACGVVKERTPSDGLIVTRRKWAPALMYLTDRLAIDGPEMWVVRGRPVYAVLSSGDPEVGLMEEEGWVIDRDRAVPIGSGGASGMWLAPVRVEEPGLDGGVLLEREPVDG